VEIHPWTFGWDALVAIGTLALAFFAFVQTWAFNRSERRRTQPVVVAHATGGGSSLTSFRVFLTNDGTGSAYNVRFGVRLDGREFAVGGGRGTRYAIAQGERLPAAGSVENALEVETDVTAWAASPRGTGVYERRVFWARYENAFGQVWETVNPADPHADFDIFPSSRWRRRLAARRQGLGRARDRRVVNRRIGEELEAVEAERGFTLRQRLRRWFEMHWG
jgi:hypothetical protein